MPFLTVLSATAQIGNCDNPAQVQPDARFEAEKRDSG